MVNKQAFLTTDHDSSHEIKDKKTTVAEVPHPISKTNGKKDIYVNYDVYRIEELSVKINKVEEMVYKLTEITIETKTIVRTGVISFLIGLVIFGVVALILGVR